MNGLNDWNFDKVHIHFEITEQFADEASDLVLTLSTLYATHEDVDSFNMSVKPTGRITLLQVWYIALDMAAATYLFCVVSCALHHFTKVAPEN